MGGLLSKKAVSEAISGSRAVHTCCCSYYCMAGNLARADQAQLSKIYYHKKEIPTCCGEKSAVFAMCYVNAHSAIVQSTCTELARGPWVAGGVWRVMTVRLNSIV